MFTPRDILSEDTESKLEEFEESLDKLSQDLKSIQSKVEELENKPTSLSFPLDPISARVINDLFKLKHYTSAELSGLIDPSEGMFVYNTTTDTLYFRKSTSSWAQVTSTIS